MTKVRPPKAQNPSRLCVSGRPWKQLPGRKSIKIKASKRDYRTPAKPGVSKFDARKIRERDLSLVKGREVELKVIAKEKRAIANKKRVEKAERKKENEIRSGQYQVIKNTSKL
ncbi:conserved hypothetical protein [Perkinsus marinus ATCC 50983]|uniref:Coiled-coil domain-containing protein 86 n=1 Tax=Perkinsus marinus (strain ATCC 50983 / TXsc) TaxID=423536 RepID=C5L416_PERM5|nr:conserved hypothetical protein [Perkinsus marinus ATCC 50983]EER08527.1 conserved hypothetical protein [Perkinsus marinus ATCC 50983]|eukprot:XP_002776711.1 conserved hypothetical protein [Perkinsus marinus ATCC 50983]